jgi:hypothetical protein
MTALGLSLAAALLAAGLSPREVLLVLVLAALHVGVGLGVLRVARVQPEDPAARIGVSFIVGVTCTALVDVALARTVLDRAGWLLVAAPLALAGLRGNRSSAFPERLRTDAVRATALALVVLAPWYWSLPAGLSILGVAAVWAARTRLRSPARVALLSGVLLGGGFAASALVRPTYWWLTQEEQLYFDLLASSVSTVGTADSTFAHGFPIRYHWLAFEWSGLWTRIAELPPQVMVSRAGPILAIVATILVMRGILGRLAGRVSEWSTLTLAALVASTPIGDGAFTWLLGDVNHGLAAALMAAAWWLSTDGSPVGRRALLLGVIVFASLGANGMYGLTTLAATSAALLDHAVRQRSLRFGGVRTLDLWSAAAVPVAGAGALWYFFGFPMADTPGNAGILGRPPFDFVRSVSRELEIFTGQNFAVVAAAFTIGAVALGGIGAVYALRSTRATPGFAGFVGGGAVAGMSLLILGHTDTYADQVLCWAAALGPALLMSSRAAVEGLQRVPRGAVLSAVVPGLVGVLIVVSHHLWGLSLVESGSATAIKVRALKGADLVPVIALVAVVHAWSHRRPRPGGSVVRSLALALTVVGVCSFAVLQGEAYRTVRPALDARSTTWIGGKHLDPLTAAIEASVPATALIATNAPDDLLVHEVVARTRRRMLVTNPPTSSVRELDQEPWSGWRRLSTSLGVGEESSRMRALDRVIEEGVSWVIYDMSSYAGSDIDARIRVVHRDSRWVLGSIKVGGVG